MKNEEQLLVRQILHKMRTVMEAETFTFKRFGSRIHSCAKERFSLPLIVFLKFSSENYDKNTQMINANRVFEKA